MITFLPLSVPFAPAQGSAHAKVEDAGAEVEQPKALAYLLQMDDVRVLIDCGCPEDFLFSGITELPSAVGKQKAETAEPESSAMAQQRQEQLSELDVDRFRSAPLDTLLKELAPTIDLVLLSHSSLDHLGLYAYAYAHLGLRSLVYATMPVQSMGKLTVLEAVQTWRSEVDIEQESKESASSRRCLPTLEQIEEAFEAVKVVRYMQPTHLEDKCASLTLTAYNAGHSLGGAIWKIRSPTSGTVVIALDWNHNRERHLDGTILLSSSATPGAPGSGGVSDAVRRPDLLITEVQRGLVTNTRRKDRDAALLDLVHSTIQAGNSVLFPIDASARLLELLVLLDQHWAYAYPHARFPLCLVSRTGKEVMERSRTYMEWMTREWATRSSETIEANQDKQTAATAQRGKFGKAAQPSSPLDFHYVKVFASLQALDEAVPHDQAKVILAVPPSMTHGPSRRLLSRFAQNPNDVIVLISRGEPNSLCRKLWDTWNGRQVKGFSWTDGKLGNAVSAESSLEYELKSKVPLEGEELRAHLEAEQAERDRLAQQRAMLARSRRRLEADEDDSSGSDSDSDDDQAEDMYDVATANGGGATEPGSLIRKRPHAVAFDEGPGAGTGDAQLVGGADTNQVSYDIYLKGNASRATSFFGSKGGQEGPYGLGARFRLFPIVERKRLVDGYGEVIDVGRWLSRRRQLEAAREGEDDGEDGDSAEDRQRKAAATAAALEAEARAIPSKYVTEQISLTVQCRLAFIEMTGLNDGRALKTLIPQLHPRRLIMVNADQPTRMDMAKALSAIKSFTNETYSPVWMHLTQIGEMTNSYTVHLGESVLAALQMSRFEEYEVAHVKAMIRANADSIPTLETNAEASKSMMEIDSSEEEGNAIPADSAIVELASAGVLRAELGKLASAEPESDEPATAPSPQISKDTVAVRLQPAGPQGSTAISPTLFIGDLKLSTLKSALGGPNYRLPAEFAGEGMLVCAPSTGTDAVTIQKHSRGRIVIEGNVTKSFKNVRNAVYGLHARVVGQQ